MNLKWGSLVFEATITAGTLSLGALFFISKIALPNANFKKNFRFICHQKK